MDEELSTLKNHMAIRKAELHGCQTKEKAAMKKLKEMTEVRGRGWVW